VGYLGDNQFGVLIAQQHDIQHLTRIAYKVYENQTSKIDASGHKIPTSISLGLSIYPDDGIESAALIEHALYALNESKKQGGDRLTFYSQPLEEATGQRRVLVQEIRKAIDSKQLFVRFQPVIDLSTGKVAKAEALIRWENPEKGEIKPQEFIDIAEDAGLIVEIGNFVFTETVNYLRKWKKILPVDFQVSINISPQQLRLSKELAKEWRAILLEKEVLGQSIVLEITEGILLQDDRQIIQSIYELREAGIRFCLDDFGTGYSSISYLKKLDIDYLKVDQSFVRDLNSNEEDQKIVEGILLLAKKMGMKSIAEGVETKDQLNCLRQFGCEYGQGFYFARAMIPDEFIEWAKERFN
jgi:EAL domain-containing protein (putative c-di-GMP-specific phosphodiesterase class I)